MTTRILLADDHDLVRDTLASFMQAQGECDVTAVSSVDAALDVMGTDGAFDLILLDYNMPGMNGLQGLSRTISAGGDTPVALLSGDASATVVDQAIAAGAAGFVPKTLGASSMIAAIRLMMLGEVFVPFNYTQQTTAASIEGLTPRETQVLKALAAGMANKEIARQLELQEVTVKLHVKTLLRKLGAKNRTQAAMIARDRKLL
ncbi:response regulator transcription factor [Yoonia sp.]|uniref:response regulator transcription factor n=1 Tax=Yoonia sp. TaxID=2212373 RepID=UPI002FD883CF